MQNPKEKEEEDRGDGFAYLDQDRLYWLQQNLIQEQKDASITPLFEAIDVSHITKHNRLEAQLIFDQIWPHVRALPVTLPKEEAPIEWDWSEPSKAFANAWMMDTKILEANKRGRF